MDVGRVKQTVLGELLEAKHDAELGKYKDLSTCKHRGDGYRAYWELQILLRETLDSIGGLDKALEELLKENKIEQLDSTGYYRTKTFYPEDNEKQKNVLRARAERAGSRFVDRYFDKLAQEHGSMVVTTLAYRIIDMAEEIRRRDKCTD